MSRKRGFTMIGAGAVLAVALISTSGGSRDPVASAGVRTGRSVVGVSATLATGSDASVAPAESSGVEGRERVGRTPSRISGRPAALSGAGDGLEQEEDRHAEERNRDRLVYASTRDGNTDLWAVNVDGTDERRLTSHEADDTYPDVSRNGRLIAFSRGISRNCSTPYYGHLWVMNSDGTQPGQLLADDLWSEFRPDFSPDGRQILFSRVPAGRGCVGVGLELWVINVDGTGLKQVREHATFGSWSPDGTKIAYGSEYWLRGANEFGVPEFALSTNVWVVNADGSDARPLTTAGGVAPQWSPDGSRIAFTSSRRAGKGDVWVMDADGNNQHYVTASPGKDGFAAWSPDSNRIAFASSRDSACPPELAEHCPHRIYTMAADGSDVRRVAANADYDILPAYFPRSTRRQGK